MKNAIYLVALVVSLGCILFLYQKLTVTEEALHQAEQKFADCQQVTFQLQMKANGRAPQNTPPAPKPAQ